MDVFHNMRTWLRRTEAARAGDRLEFWEDEDREWRWRIVAANNRIVAASSEGFSSKAAAQLNLRRTRAALNSKLTVEMTPLADRPAAKGTHNGP